MKRNDIKISRSFKATCCIYRFDSDSEHEMWEKLLDHVREAHVDFYEGVVKEARRMARRNNGFGYWDSDDSDGWSKASPGFQQAYMIKALQMSVQGHCFP